MTDTRTLRRAPASSSDRPIYRGEILPPPSNNNNKKDLTCFQCTARIYIHTSDLCCCCCTPPHPIPSCLFRLLRTLTHFLNFCSFCNYFSFLCEERGEVRDVCKCDLWKMGLTHTQGDICLWGQHQKLGGKMQVPQYKLYILGLNLVHV